MFGKFVGHSIREVISLWTFWVLLIQPQEKTSKLLHCKENTPFFYKQSKI